MFKILDKIDMDIIDINVLKHNVKEFYVHWTKWIEKCLTKDLT